MARPIDKNELTAGRAALHQRTKFPASCAGIVQADHGLRRIVFGGLALPRDAASVNEARARSGEVSVSGASGEERGRTHAHGRAQTLRLAGFYGIGRGFRRCLQENVIRRFPWRPAAP